MNKRTGYLAILAAIVLISSLALPSCKSKSNKEAVVSTADTTKPFVAAPSPLGGANLPHADSSLAPVLAKVMDDAFAASKAKDYAKLASYLVYRGPDMKRFGYDVFNTKNAYERGVVRVTADVFNKWNSQCETKDYSRIFSLAQADGREMVVLEVIFASPRSVDRRFFGFLPFNKTDYKIVDVTSNLELPNQ